MDEIPGFGAVRVPDDIKEGRKLFRALCNVRPPMEASEEFLKIQDEELSFQREEKGVVSLEDIPGGRIRLWQGDITRLGVDAIVNAANSALRGCFHPLHGCIDNAIHSSAGIQLRLECDRIMKAQGMEEPAGKAKITDAYNLPCRKVIHTVGPIVWGTEPSDEDERQLAQCYEAAFRWRRGKGSTRLPSAAYRQENSISRMKGQQRSQSVKSGTSWEV